MPLPQRARPMAESTSRVENAMRQYLPLVWRLLRRSGLAANDADDGVQDVFWVFAQRLDDVNPHADRSFLVATALRVASERRRSKWYRSAPEPLDIERFPIESTAPDQIVDRRRQVEMLDALLDDLEPKLREVFILCEIEEMSKSEISATLQIPEGTVASRLLRARQCFRASAQRLNAQKGRRR